MKRLILMFSAAVAALVSCYEDPVQVPDGDYMPEDVRKVSIKAATLSKSALSGEEVWWEAEDQIALVFTHQSNAPHVNKTFVNDEKENASYYATFTGAIPNSVTVENGYEDLGFAVYPVSAVTEGGVYSHDLPEVQYAKANGSFPSGCNLSSAALFLSDMDEEGSSTESDFRSALSLLRLELSPDIESVTVTGTAPLAGVAPLGMFYKADADENEARNNGRLLVDPLGEWSEASTSVTLLPEDGKEFSAQLYHLLVWPGKQEGLTITVSYKNIGEYTKTSSVSADKPATFKPGMYYKLNFKNTEELVIEEFDAALDKVEGDVADLVAQIQSATLLTEYLDNAVYARYAQMTYSKQKIDVSLDYIVRPETAAEALAEAFGQNPSVVSALLGYDKGSGLELESESLDVKDLFIKDVVGIGKVVTATIDASTIDNKFYEGNWGASVALQIACGKTDVISDFAHLVPKAGSTIAGNNLIPAVPGARVVIPFSYAVSGDASYTLAVTASQGVSETSMNYYDNSKTGNLTVSFAEGAIQSPSVTLTLTVGEGVNKEIISHEFTFVDSGSRIEFVNPGQVDYIGGEVSLGVNTQNIQSYSLSCSGDGVSQSGSIFTFSQNNGNQRTATIECQATIPGVSFNYYKSIAVTQKAYGTSLSKTYYTNGHKEILNQANAVGCSNYFNIVILGDGYQKRDLVVGGKFERSARSAMESFFAIEPYKTFRERFNVYMVAYESTDEGTDIKSSSIEKNTYFGSYCQGGGNTASYVSDTAPVINAVKSAVGYGDAQYYRTIAILLVNTDEQAGSTGYPFRDSKAGFVNGYASFAIAVLAANSTSTNGLIKHEAGGHAFGRLADEYYSVGSTASSSNKTELRDWHVKGWYWNVSHSNSGNYYNFTNSAYSSSEVSFIEGGWGYASGIYRPTPGGMMQGNTGVFNAPSRHAIYHRIITESEGDSAYSWQKFLAYDQINR